MCRATSGARAKIIGNASAHDAQYAAGAVLEAERKPAPPHRKGRPNKSFATIISSDAPDSKPSNFQAVAAIPSSCAAA